jgi:hypothetical protein
VKIIIEIGVQIPSVGNTHDDLTEFTDLRVAQKLAYYYYEEKINTDAPVEMIERMSLNMCTERWQLLPLLGRLG